MFVVGVSDAQDVNKGFQLVVGFVYVFSKFVKGVLEFRLERMHYLVTLRVLVGRGCVCH